MTRHNSSKQALRLLSVATRGLRTGTISSRLSVVSSSVPWTSRNERLDVKLILAQTRTRSVRFGSVAYHRSSKLNSGTSNLETSSVELQVLKNEPDLSDQQHCCLHHSSRRGPGRHADGEVLSCWSLACLQSSKWKPGLHPTSFRQADLWRWVITPNL